MEMVDGRNWYEGRAWKGCIAWCLEFRVMDRKWLIVAGLLQDLPLNQDLLRERDVKIKENNVTLTSSCTVFVSRFVKSSTRVKSVDMRRKVIR